MLGVGSGAGRSGKVRKIVKNGLQAWYKADKTQAPLGEEEIANGDFSLGSELANNSAWIRSTSVSSGGDLDDGDDLIFPGNSNTAFTPGQSDITLGPEGFRFVTQGGSNYIGMFLDVILTEANSSNATVAVTYTILQSNDDGALSIANTPNDVHLDTSVGTHTVYFEPGRNDFLIKRRGNSMDVTIANVSVKRTNPNDSWVPEDTSWVVKDGSAEYTDGSGTKYIKTAGSVATIGKKYKLTYTVSGNTGRLGIFDDGAANDILSYVDHSVGDHELEFVSQKTGRIMFYSTNDSAGDFSISNISLKEITNSVRDYSKNNNNAVLYSGKALEFDGASDYVTLDYPAAGTAVDSNFKCTVALWFNAATLGQYMIFGTAQGPAGSNDQHNRFYLWTDQSKLYFNFGWQSGPPTTGSIPNIVADRWYRAVIVVDGLTAYVYLDGELKYTRTSAAFDQPTLSANLTLGRNGSSNSYQYDGMISDFQAYDKTWTASDVKYDWENPDKDVFDGSSNISPTDCKALYRLNEGAGDRVYNAAPVLGTEMWDGTSGDISNWANFGGDGVVYDNAIENDNGAVKITYEQGANGRYIHLRDDYQTNADLVVGKTYVLSITTKVNQGSVEWRLKETDDPTYNFPTLTSTNFITQSITFIATSVNSHYLYPSNMEAGEQVWIKDISLKPVTLSNSHVQESWVSGNWKTAQPYIPQYAMSSYSKKIVFTGIDEKIDLGETNTIADDAAFSVSFWYQHEATGDTNYVIGSNSGEDYLRVDHSADEVVLRINDSSCTFDVTESTLNDFKLAHLCITRVAGATGNLNLYVNGVFHSTIASPSVGEWVYRYFGSYGGTTSMNGFLDEIAIFNTELSANEVSELFNGGMALDARDHSTYLGTELVDDGGFDTDVAESTSGTHWITQAGWTISGGSATYDGGGDSNTKLQTVTNPSFIDSKIHELAFDLTDTGGGGVYVKLCDGGWSPLITGTGTKTVYLTAGTGINRLEFETGHDDKAFTIDNVSVKEVQLKGYWRNNGVDEWTDLSEYGNNGTVNGSPTTIQLQEVPYFGKDSLGLPMNRVRQGGLNFDGASYVKISDDTSLDVATTNEITVECWYKAHSTSSYDEIQYLVASEAWSSADGWGLGTNASNIFFSAQDADVGGGDNEDAVVTHSNNTSWVHIVATNDETNHKIYINGELKDTGPADVAMVDKYPIYIGSLGAGSFTKGIIDDVKIYNRVLTLPEITKNQKRGLSKHKNNTVSNWSDDFSDSFI